VTHGQCDARSTVTFPAAGHHCPLVKLVLGDRGTPHCGLPPCHGGGAYAPMTQTIFNLKERS